MPNNKYQKQRYGSLSRFLANVRTLSTGQNDKGSATLEFVALAIPLLIPLLIFASHLSLTASTQLSLHNTLRESSHLFIGSKNDFVARERVDLFMNKTFPNAKILITCESYPCLTHNSWINFEITIDGHTQKYNFQVGTWQ